MKHTLTGTSYFKNVFIIGKYMYLVGLAELAIYNFFKEDFAMTRPPALPDWLKGINPAMAYSTGIVLLICIAGVLWNKYTSLALFTISAIVLLCATTRHASNAWKDPVNAFKTLWLIGGALLILSVTDQYKKYHQPILFANIIILFMFFYHCAVGHFGYAVFIKDLILPYIPFRLFFTYFAGICLLLAAIGLLIPKTQKLAALLSGIQITGWFALLHVPRALINSGDTWIGVGESLAVAGICFMLYEIFRRKHFMMDLKSA